MILGAVNMVGGSVEPVGTAFAATDVVMLTRSRGIISRHP
jgi:hypothetical protein